MERIAVRSPGGDDDIELALTHFVERNVVVDGRGVDREERLVESGRVDSLGLLQIVGFVTERFAVDLLVLGSPRDLLSVAALAAAVRRETAARQRAEGA